MMAEKTVDKKVDWLVLRRVVLKGKMWADA